MTMSVPQSRPTPTSVILLSGGIDSATVAALLTDQGWNSHALFIDYGQLAADDERQASRELAAHYQLQWREVPIRGLDTPSFTEVRGRNDMLIAIAGAASPADAVAIGTHASTSYADCSPVHARAWQELLDTQYGGSRRLVAPLQAFSKTQIVALALRLDVPLTRTYSCEDARGPCGRCVSCRDRERALAGT